MIDSHCHLDHEYLFKNLDQILIRSKEVGIKKILTICTTFESFDIIKKLVKKDIIIFGTYGIHPHEAKNYKVTDETIAKKINMNEKIIGIGETGLDFYYNLSDKDDQIQSFEEHIKASIKLNIPLIIHSRNAEDEMMEIFNKYKNVYFSASGIITFNNSNELQEVFRFIPLEKTLIETDSPYLTPVPHRGKKNEPSFVKFTAEKLAKIKNISSSDLAKITTTNFNRLFKQ